MPPSASDDNVDSSVGASYRYMSKFAVIKKPGDFQSKLVTRVPFRKGEVLAHLQDVERNAEKRWSSVQVSPTEHIELRSELVYMNHSCDPSVHIDTTMMAVVAGRDLQSGDEICFFYPSTEWDMSQPFDCWCGAAQCNKRIAGARHMPPEVLDRYFINEHIRSLQHKLLPSQ
ncbi:hypothetical protein HDV00_003086 [Rhizophlyctis rosea]|nr:hypothetical protein HDV00_003086 [Rhizophlyctis rosea]